jgi:hypothetical protein
VEQQEEKPADTTIMHFQRSKFSMLQQSKSVVSRWYQIQCNKKPKEKWITDEVSFRLALMTLS